MPEKNSITIVNNIVSKVLATILVNNVSGFATVNSSSMNNVVKKIDIHINEYIVYLPHVRLFTPGVKSSGNPFCVKADSKGLRIKPSNVVAAALSPGVLQKMSTPRVSNAAQILEY